MSSFNLPPGCSVNDIPGNRPEDSPENIRIEVIYEQIDGALIEASRKNEQAHDRAADAIFALIEKAYAEGFKDGARDERESFEDY